MGLIQRYASELESLGSTVTVTGITGARVLDVNHDLQQQLGMQHGPFAGEQILTSLFDPEGFTGARGFAQKYGGHQFGGWNPELGDGRGVLLGEWQCPNGQYWDLHLKGAGQTPYSRFGDGRAVLRSTIREYLASEALHCLGIPTSRALCLIGSDEPVYREQPETAAMLVRVCPSHIRFGHFEYFFHSGQLEKLEQLFAYCFRYHFPQCQNAPNPHLAMLTEVVDDTARMIASWQAQGFAHGVMNTDNMSIHGITFDYGPYGFMDDFDPAYICNHSDHQGRYAFEQQPGVGLWNLNALAQAFTPYASIEQLRPVLEQYEVILQQHYWQLMAAKFGMGSMAEQEYRLCRELLNQMVAEGRDYHQTFQLLSDVVAGADPGLLLDQFVDRQKLASWLGRYQACLQQPQHQGAVQRMHTSNSRYVLRNYLAQQVIEAAEKGDMAPLRRWLAALRKPFTEQSGCEDYQALPPDWGKTLQISCSS